MPLFILEPILWLLIFCLVFYFHGAILIGNIQQSKLWPEKFFVNTVLGLAFVIFLLFILALFKLLRIEVLVIALSIVPIFYLSKNYSLKFSIRRFYHGLTNHVGLVIVLIYFIFGYTSRLFLPEDSADALSYHLPYARFYVENNGLAVNEYLRYPLFSHNMNLIFSMGLIFQGEVLARAFNVLAMLLMVMGLYSLVTRSFNSWMATLVCLILIKAKMLRVLMLSAYIDIGLALFIFTCIYFIYLWQKEKQISWIYFAGVMLGTAIGTKYLGLVWLIPLTLWVYALTYEKHLTSDRWKAVTRFFLIALLFGSPWYIRNIIIAGNPIHPFAQEFFGYWLWTSQDILAQNKDLLVINGVPKTFLNFLKLPWLLDTFPFYRHGNIDITMILGIPLAFIAILLKPFFRYMALFLLFNLVFWFYTTQIPRYLIVAFPIMALFAALPINYIFNKLRSYQIFQSSKVSRLLSLLLIIFVINITVNKLVKHNEIEPIPNSQNQWGEYLLSSHKENELIKVANDLHVDKLFKLGFPYSTYYFNGQMLGDWYGKANMINFNNNAQSANDVKLQLQQFNTQYLLVSKENAFFSKIIKLVKHDSDFINLKENEKGILYHISP